MHLHVVKPDPDSLACISMPSELHELGGHNFLNQSSNSSETFEVDERVTMVTGQRIQCSVTIAPSHSPSAVIRQPSASHPPCPRYSGSSSPTRHPTNTVASTNTFGTLASPLKHHTTPNQCVHAHHVSPFNGRIHAGLLGGCLPNADSMHHQSPLLPMAGSTISSQFAVDNGATKPVQSAYPSSASKETSVVAVVPTSEHQSPSVTAAECRNAASNPEYLCAICRDKASGRHYGVLSCEGCKGFFKRTVRKQTQYICRNGGQCPVDRRKRTRCQACRYRRCINVGMRREAVQEERQHAHRSHSATPCDTHQCTAEVVTDNEESALPSTGSACDTTPTAAVAELDDSTKILPDVTTLTPTRSQLTLTNLLDAEMSADRDLPNPDIADSIYIDIGEDSVDPLVLICQSVERQLSRLLTWARQVIRFSSPFLSVDDQFCLLKSAWSELLLIGAAYNSTVVEEGLLLASGRHLSREKARQHGLGSLMDRFLTELVARFRELHLQRIELAFLRAIILFNPDANNLTARGPVESVRETLYAGLHAYCSTNQANDASRFTKLLLRLPPLRSIAHKCLEHLVFVKLAAEDPTSRRLINLVEHGVWPSTDPCDIPTQIASGTVI